MNTIYNTFIKMESQEECDKMKQICIDNELPIGKFQTSFELIKSLGYLFFHYSENSKVFFIGDNYYNFKKITKKEFIELIKTTKLQPKK